MFHIYSFSISVSKFFFKLLFKTRNLHFCQSVRHIEINDYQIFEKYFRGEKTEFQFKDILNFPHWASSAQSYH